MDSGTLTPVLKKLQELQLITRKRSELDDRSVSANELKSEALKNVIELFCNTGMSVEEVTQIRDSTQRLLHILSGKRAASG